MYHWCFHSRTHGYPSPPLFSSVHVIGWTIDIQQYFDYLETPDIIRLLLVGILFDHPRYKWFHNY